MDHKHSRKSTIKHVYRSMLGAFVGDAAGATLEFGGKPTSEMVRHAMTMPGGGVHRVGPGQITDDGELILAAFQHISPWRDGLGIPRTNLIRAYGEWYKTRPFDIGATCASAFSGASECIPRGAEKVTSLDYEKIKEFEDNVESHNQFSQANGALMRASALATWFSLTNAESFSLARGIAEVDANLSHPNPICVEVNKVYVSVLACLLDDVSPQDTLTYICDIVENKIQSSTVKQWFEESHSIENLDCEVNQGHVKYAFILAMYFLRNPHITYEDAIYQTLMKGGDTDTNACIVGGLVACYQPIPEYMEKPVLEFDCTKEGVLRPPQYSVKRLFNGELMEYVKKYYGF